MKADWQSSPPQGKTGITAILTKMSFLHIEKAYEYLHIMSIFCSYDFKIDWNIDKNVNKSEMCSQFLGKTGISALSASPGKTGIIAYNYD